MTPIFTDKEFLLGHINSIMDFYHPRCVDTEVGGFFQHFRDNGSVYDSNTRHLVSSTRFIFNYAMAAKEFNNSEYLDVAQHGIKYLRQFHLNSKTGGYAWILNNKTAQDSTNYCYGLAFVLLAYSTAYNAGLSEAKKYIDETFNLMEKYFWSEDDGLYCDEISADWSRVSEYRGQNANMHSCEALIMAFEATQEEKYLQRALLVARNICQRQANLADGLIWEHYDYDWQIDWSFNKDTPDDLFRPWGFQIGHLSEWAKLLIILERYIDEDWLLKRAIELFYVAVDKGWDSNSGGLVYGIAPDCSVCDGDKYFWVQAETIVAAALLAKRTGKKSYWDWYNRIWEYSWMHMVDHEYGAWFRILDSDNNKYDNLKSPAGKTDYHTMGACYEVLNAL
jgi:mannose/cellobiose epimerase-like protein (N-acyl-D-glucosamine 2-epimerase family)